MTFFQKVHFIQKCSVTQNTVFQHVKNIFLLSQKKLIFFTELNLMIMNVMTVRLHLVMASLVRSSRVLSCSSRSEVWRLATS